MNKNWVYYSQTTGTSGTTVITVSAGTNYNDYQLIESLIVSTDFGVKNVLVTQEEKPDYAKQYLTLEILTAGTITWAKSNVFASDRTIQYSKDNGSTWTSITSSRDGVSFNVSEGDKVLFKGNNAHFATSNLNYSYFKTTCVFKIYGNIMSLLYGDNFVGQTILNSGSTFCSMFINNTGLTNAEFLQLPALSIQGSCYEALFSGCTNLEKAIDNLPARKLDYECYENMFAGCVNLTNSPTLPATMLETSCYQKMFFGCSKLRYIKCMAVDISATDCTTNFTNGVASSGTFVKKSGVSWPTGNNGIPNNWTVIDG